MANSNLLRAKSILDKKGYKYECRGNEIRVLDNDRLLCMSKLQKCFEPLGYKYTSENYRSSFGCLALKGKKRSNVYIINKRETGGPAAAGVKYEDHVASLINKAQCDFTVDTAGQKHGCDITISKDGSVVTSVETKTSLGADFGQFTIKYNLLTKQWQPKPTKGYLKYEKVLKPLCKIAIEWANQNMHFPNVRDEHLNIKNDCIMSFGNSNDYKKILQSLWFDKTSQKLPIDKLLIENYYREKGNNYIQIRDLGLYDLSASTNPNIKVPRFSDLPLHPYLRIRLKPGNGTTGYHSFTVAIKISWKKSEVKKSNLSLTEKRDLKVIMMALNDAHNAKKARERNINNRSYIYGKESKSKD